VYVVSTAPSADAQGYLQDLMQAGQHAMKQFDDALAAAAGVDKQEAALSGRSQVPFLLFLDLQREYFKQIWQLWSAIFLQAYSAGTHADSMHDRGGVIND
jgi:hypothetical protein